MLFLLIVFAWLTAACDKLPPTASTPVLETVTQVKDNPSPVVEKPLVVDAFTQDPIEATVILVKDDKTGRMSAEISAPGYLSPSLVDYQQGATLDLLPLPKAGQEFVQEAIYSYGGVLKRIGSNLQIEYNPAIMSDNVGKAAWDLAIASANEMLGDKYRIAYAGHTDGGVIKTVMNESIPTAAQVWLTYNNGILSEALIEFKYPINGKDASIILHELGHIIGFGHTTQAGVMYGGPYLFRTFDVRFTNDEMHAGLILFARPPLTRWTDDRRVVSLAASEGRGKVKLECWGG